MEKEKNLLKIAMIPILTLILNGCSNKKTDFLPLEEVIFTTKDLDGSTLLFKKFVKGGSSFYRDKDNENYYTDLAKIIISQFENNKSLQVKRRVMQKFNYDSIFKETERIIYEDWL